MKRIPFAYSFLASVFILFLGAFQAKSLLYREKDIDLLASLPLKSLPIASARVFRCYVDGFLITALILLPSFVLYAIFEPISVAGLICLLLIPFLLPVLPTALAVWVGMGFSAIIARNRHKVLTETLLAVILGVGTLLLPFFIGGGNSTSFGEGFSLQPSNRFASEESISQLADQVRQSMDGLTASHPFLTVCRDVFLGKNMPGLLTYGLASFFLIILTTLVVGKNFFPISRKLLSREAHHEYHLTSLQKQSVLKALIQKEVRCYFSNGVYVSNTIIGPVFAVAFSIALGFFNPVSLLNDVGGLPVTLHVEAGIPFLLGTFFAMMSPASSSISIEGKNWWIMKSLPISPKEILQAKLLFSLILSTPFYCIMELILLFTVRAGFLERLWLILAPAVMILFATVWGVLMNLKFPKLRWENASEVVKQSAACGLSLLATFVGLLPFLVLILLPESLTHLATLGFLLMLGGVTYLFYRFVTSSSLAFS